MVLIYSGRFRMYARGGGGGCCGPAKQSRESDDRCCEVDKRGQESGMLLVPLLGILMGKERKGLD